MGKFAGRDVSSVIPGCSGVGTEWNEKRFRLKWRSGSLMCWARSAVLIMVVAVETSRQCFRVSSDIIVSLMVSKELGLQPRRLVLINADMALSLERARIVITISGELVVNTAMKSPLETPLLLKKAANLFTST